MDELDRLGECTGLAPVLVAVPFRLDDATARRVLGRKEVAGLVAEGDLGSLAADFPGRVGTIVGTRGDWTLPGVGPANLLFLGSNRQIGYRMARAALRAGVRKVYFPRAYGIGWVVSSAWRLLGLSALRGVANRLQLRLRVMDNPWAQRLGVLSERRYAPAFRADRAKLRRSVLAPGEFSNTIVMVTGSMAGGGAERQVANTLLGLNRRSRSVSLICERLDAGSHDFFLSSLQQAHIPASVLRKSMDHEVNKGFGQVEGRLSRSLNALPFWVAEGILAYACEFLRRRPGIVHAWQDETNIKAGVAALAVGVPRIVVSTRSMAPIHFALFQPFMREGYRLLARFPQVTFLNNSKAGAADYARWLGVPPERIQVVHNGVNLDELTPPAREEVDAWRREAGLGEGGLLVGTVLRFTEEKGPLLWVRTAQAVARRRSDVQFLMIGGGPMLEEARRLAGTLGIADRVFMPGMHARPSVPLSCMDVFLLTSRLEGLPNVIIEAQALGVPVVTTDAGGSAEAIDAGGTGWAVRPHSPDALAERVLDVLENDELRRKAAEGARKFVAERFALERMIDETVSVYEQPVQGAPR